MKGRKWVLVGIILLLIVIGGYVAAFRVLRINQRARLFISEKISTFLGADFDASSVYFVPWSFGIRDAHLQLKDIPVRIYAKRIRIEFNLFSFLRNGLRPVSGTKQIFLDNPSITWFLDDTPGKPGDFKFEGIPEFSLTNLPLIQINFSEGSFIFRKGDSTLVFADNIRGWLDGSGASIVNLNVEGRILSNEINTTCKGNFNRINDTLFLDLSGRQCDLSLKGLNVLTGVVRPESGILDFTFHVEKKNGKLTLNGTYAVEEGSFALHDYQIGVNDVFVKGNFTEEEIILDSVTGKIFDVSPKLSGRLKLKPEPSLYFVVDAENIDLSNVLSDIYPEKKPQINGVVNLSAIVEGTLNDLSLKMQISTDSVRFNQERFDDVELSLTMDGRDVIFEHISVLYRDFKVNGRGKTTRFLPSAQALSQKRNITLSLNTYRISDPTQIFMINLRGTTHPEIEEYSADFDMKLKQPVKSKSGDLKYTLFDEINGSIYLKEDSLQYNFGNQFMTFDGVATHIFDKVEIASELTIASLPILNFLGIQDQNFYVEGKGYVQGDFDILNVTGDFGLHAGDKFNSELSGEAVIRDIFTGSRSVAVDAELNNLYFFHSHPLNYKVILKADSLETFAEIFDMDGAAMTVNVLHETGALSGNLKLDAFPLERIIDIFKKEEFNYRGKLTGEVKIKGTIKEPNFNTPDRIHITDLNVGGLDELSGAGYISGHFGALNFSDVNFSRKGTHILNADGRWVKGSPFVLDAVGKDIDMKTMGEFISNKRKCLGTADYEFTMVFTRKDGTIDGKFSLRDGYFLDIPFDEASGIISGGSKGFHATDFTIVKNGFYSGEGSASSGYLWKDVTEESGLKMDLFFQGDLLRILPVFTNAVKEASGKSHLELTIGGTWEDPVLFEGELHVTGGILKSAFLVDTISDVNVLLSIDSDMETLSGLRAVKIRAASGIIKKKRIIFQNIHAGEKEWEPFPKKMPELFSIVLSTLDLDFGVLLGGIDDEKNRDSSIDLHIPGFMYPKDIGTFLISGKTGKPFIIGSADAGGHLSPYISGDILVLSGDIIYPLLTVSSTTNQSDLLNDIFWNLSVRAGSHVTYEYVKNLKWGNLAGTTVFRTLAMLNENSEFNVFGRISDGSFHVSGDARSTSGTISLFGADFDIDRAEFELDTANIDKPASLTARARTTVYDDSSGVETEIYLYVNSVDRESGKRTQASALVEPGKDDILDVSGIRTIDLGAFGILEIEFKSTNPADDTQEKILAKLGISPENIRGAVTGAFTSGVDNYYFNLWMRPIEVWLRRKTSLDVVRFTPSVLGNIVRQQLGFTDRFSPDSDFMLFDRSRIMFGEYFYEDWFLSYRGQYGVGRDFLRRKERGFFHEIGLQYLIKRDTRILLIYNYDDVTSIGEKRFEIRHDFEF